MSLLKEHFYKDGVITCPYIEDGNKIRLAICMNDNYSHTNLEYDKNEMHKYFDSLLKEINIDYRSTLINFANYPYIMFAMAKIMEIDSFEQNKVALYLFNSINWKIKNI